LGGGIGRRVGLKHQWTLSLRVQFPFRVLNKYQTLSVIFPKCLIFISMIKIDDEYFITVCNQSKSMAEASAKLKLHFNTFKRIASKLGCYNPNQSGKGITKKSQEKIPLDEILNGKHPQFQTYKLKNKLLKQGVFKNECSICGISEWNNNKLNMELDHIDGNKYNHLLNNLRLLCPNCHSQTDTYRAKNIK